MAMVVVWAEGEPPAADGGQDHGIHGTRCAFCERFWAGHGCTYAILCRRTRTVRAVWSARGWRNRLPLEIDLDSGKVLNAVSTATTARRAVVRHLLAAARRRLLEGAA